MRVSTVLVALLLLAGMLLSAFGLSQFEGEWGWPRTWAQAGGVVAWMLGIWIMIPCGELLGRRAVRRIRTLRVGAGSD